MLLMFASVFSMRAMGTSSERVSRWTQEHQTALVAGSIVGVGGATAYYFESPKIFGASVVGAGVYVACRSFYSDDAFQARLKALVQQSGQINAQYKVLDSGLDNLLQGQRDVTASMVQLSDAAQRVEGKVSELSDKVKKLPDASFLHDITALPQSVEEVQTDIAKNVAICNNIGKQVESAKEDAQSLRTNLQGVHALLAHLSEIGKQAGDLRRQHMNERAARTEQIAQQETAEILKLIKDQSPAGGKLSGSY